MPGDRLCRFWVPETGTGCRNGELCPFLHVLPADPLYRQLGLDKRDTRPGGDRRRIVEPLSDNIVQEIRQLIEKHGGMMDGGMLCGMKEYRGRISKAQLERYFEITTSRGGKFTVHLHGAGTAALGLPQDFGGLQLNAEQQAFLLQMQALQAASAHAASSSFAPAPLSWQAHSEALTSAEVEAIRQVILANGGVMDGGMLCGMNQFRKLGKVQLEKDFHVIPGEGGKFTVSVKTLADLAPSNDLAADQSALQLLATSAELQALQEQQAYHEQQQAMHAQQSQQLEEARQQLLQMQQSQSQADPLQTALEQLLTEKPWLQQKPWLIEKELSAASSLGSILQQGRARSRSRGRT